MCLTPLRKGIQITSTCRFYLTAIRMAITKGTNQSNYHPDEEERDACQFLILGRNLKKEQ